MRVTWLSAAAGAVVSVILLPLGGVFPRVFTSDAEVLAQARFSGRCCAMQPLNGAVFAIDGF